ncbi:tRNA glutamyl-Q(34) synthetase GluQRS [Deltaproteobacteria bacterium Smac51]|nr:tRNA glutamyl-Q(34) synthetase GluQRS [Deltaproteobacteria bacterium Smac51]
MVRGRLAPSPTGFLHLGNAWAFWMAWLDVRSRGGRLFLRMEDIDPDRSKHVYSAAIKRDLDWLGLDWDEESPPQSTRYEIYEQVLTGLKKRGLVYRCYCTRKELRTMAGAPQVGDAGAPYPGTCRNLRPEERAGLEAKGRKSALRLLCPTDVPLEFTDRIMGRQTITLTDSGGDFALQRSDGVYAYQLAVVVDDLEAGIDSVVRGGDILASTPRQLYLYSVLGGTPPEYAHLPLIVDHEGERLAKRHDALSLAALKEAGVRPETILGSLLFLSGLRDGYQPAAAGEPLNCLRLESLSPKPITLPSDPTSYFLDLQRGRRIKTAIGLEQP